MVSRMRRTVFLQSSNCRILYNVNPEQYVKKIQTKTDPWDETGQGRHPGGRVKTWGKWNFCEDKVGEIDVSDSGWLSEIILKRQEAATQEEESDTKKLGREDDRPASSNPINHFSVFSNNFELN